MRFNFKNNITILLMIGLMLINVTVFSLAEEYPNKPIRFIVPFSAGGGSDTFARALAPFLSEELGVEVLVENKPGAGSQVGLTELLNSEPEGYVFANANQIHTSSTIHAQGASYSVEDFAWLNFHQEDPVTVIALKDAPWNDFKEVLSYIKENPGEVAIGCQQMSGAEIIMKFLQSEHGYDFIIVPYPGGSEGRTALLGGHVDIYFGEAGSNYSIVEQSKGLAIGSDQEHVLWPGTPTFKELFNNMPKLNQIVKALTTRRGLAFSKEFKYKYPDRFEKFAKAYYNAFYSPGHMEAVRKTGMDAILRWFGPIESEILASDADDIMREYVKYFE